jgi:DnaK suppressor protein
VDEVKNLRGVMAVDVTGDTADAAFEAGSGEVSSQMDSRELSQIERALARLKQGKYGTCENCEKKITLARLNALPYATLCINCERQMEKYPGRQEGKSNWGQVIESGAPRDDRGLKLSGMEMSLSSKSRW